MSWAGKFRHQVHMLKAGMQSHMPTQQLRLKFTTLYGLAHKDETVKQSLRHRLPETFHRS